MDITDKINEESKEPLKTRLFSTEPFEEEKKEETDSLNEDKKKKFRKSFLKV